VTVSPSTVGSLVNSSPLCRGVQLLASRQRSDLAVFTWLRVGEGYRPAPTGLLGSRAVGAVIERPQFDAPNSYAILLTFKGADANLLRQITTTTSTAAHAANPVAPDGMIGIFLGLTDSDISSWDAVQASVMKPVSEGGKLVSNPVSFEPVLSGELLIFVGSDLRTGCSLTASGG
jgi:hypothetical protein